MHRWLRMISPFNRDTDMPAAVYVAKKLLAFALLYAISVVVAEAVVIGIHFLLGYNVLAGEMLSARQMTLLKYYGYAIFMGIAVLYCRTIEKRSLADMGFNKNGLSYLKGAVIGVLSLAASLGLSALFGGISYRGISASIDLLDILVFFGGFLIQGVMEETFCRGFLMLSLAKRLSMPAAVFLSMLAFAVPHFPSLFTEGVLFGAVGAINLLLISLVFSLLVLRDKSLWGACAMHSIWNFCLYSIVGLSLSGAGASGGVFCFEAGPESLANGGVYGIEASLCVTAVLAVYSAYLGYRVYRESGSRAAV